MHPPVGAHVSAAGGLGKLLVRADELEVEAVQLHPSAPQSYRQPSFDDQAAADWRAAVQQRGWPVFFHGIYLINLASEDDRLWHASISSVISYLNWAPKLAAIGSITHLGSHKGRGLAAVRDRLQAAAKKIAAGLEPGAGKLIIENTAGGGGTLGRDVAELADLFAIFSAEIPTGVCLDTCHLYASGVDLASDDERGRWLAEFDRSVGISNLSAIHFNDSIFELDSKRDRHANLGDGQLGAGPLAAFMREAGLKDVPFILEVPGSGSGPDRPNIELAKSWRTS